MREALGDKHVEQFLRSQAMPGEVVRNWVVATRHGDVLQGRLITTNMRLVYYRKGSLQEKIEAWSINKISSIEAKAGLLLTKFKLYTSGDKIEVDLASDKRVNQEFVNELQQAIAGIETAPIGVAQPPQPNDDPMTALTQLRALKDAGLIDEAEFTAKKSEILARL